MNGGGGQLQVVEAEAERRGILRKVYGGVGSLWEHCSLEVDGKT